MPRLPLRAAVGALVLLAAPTLRAQDPVPLGFGVPGDTHVFIHGRTSAQPDPGTVAVERAFTRLLQSGIHEDVIELAALDMGRRQADALRAGFRQVLDVLGRADWRTLMGTEVAFAERIVLPMPEYVLLCRVPADAVAAQLAGVRAMLDGIAELAGSPEVSVREVDHRAGKLIVLTIEGAPIELAVGASADVIVFSTSTRTTVASLRGLQGDGARSVVRSARVEDALARLPEGTESTSYVDFAGLFGFMSQALGLAEAGVGGDDEALAMVRLFRAVIDEVNVVDALVATAASDGTTLVSSSLVQLREGAHESRLLALTAEQQPWTDWHRLVPADATGFAFDVGLDPGGLMDLAVSIATETLGAAPWSEHPVYREIRAKVGYLSGEVANVTFPGPDGHGSEQAWLLRLEDTEGVADWIGAHLHWLGRQLATRGQTMTVTTDGGLHRIEIGAFPHWKPVLGVRGDFVVIASSPYAVEHVEQVRRGQAPDIRQNQRFAQLGIGAESDGSYLAFGHSGSGVGEVADALAAAGFFLSVLPEDRDTRPAIRVGAILTKLAPALRELDVRYDYGAEVLPADDSGAMLSRTVVRYRETR